MWFPEKYHAIKICTDIKWHISQLQSLHLGDQLTTLQNLDSVTNSKCRIRTDYFVLLRLRILLYLHKQLICFLYENQSIWFSARHNMSDEHEWFHGWAWRAGRLLLFLNRWRGLSFYTPQLEAGTTLRKGILKIGSSPVEKWIDAATSFIEQNIKDPLSANVQPVIAYPDTLTTPPPLQYIIWVLHSYTLSS